MKKMPIDIRFWTLVKIGNPDECWEWKGAKLNSGYGAFTNSNGKQTTAHRIAFWLSNGEIEPNKVICHKCDNKLCVNPGHLFMGTQQDNINDMIGKGRAAKKEQLGRVQVGELNNCAKTTEKQVLEIRDLYKQGRTLAQIGKTTGVDRRNVWAIVHRKSWTHI